MVPVLRMISRHVTTQASKLESDSHVEWRQAILAEAVLSQFPADLAAVCRGVNEVRPEEPSSETSSNR